MPSGGGCFTLCGQGGCLRLAHERGVVVKEESELSAVPPTALRVLGTVALIWKVSGISWTVPTVVGPNVYARDRKNIVAVSFK